MRNCLDALEDSTKIQNSLVGCDFILKPPQITKLHANLEIMVTWIPEFLQVFCFVLKRPRICCGFNRKHLYVSTSRWPAYIECEITGIIYFLVFFGGKMRKQSVVVPEFKQSFITFSIHLKYILTISEF